MLAGSRHDVFDTAYPQGGASYRLVELVLNFQSLV